MLIFKIYKILSFEYSYSSKFNAIHYFDSKWDHKLKNQAVTKQIVAAFLFEARNLFGTLIFRFLSQYLQCLAYDCQSRAVAPLAVLN